MNIAIVGAGPAGLACASQLIKSTHQITMFERRVDSSPQGSGVVIQPVGLAALQALGVREELESLGQRLTFIRGYAQADRKLLVINADYSLLTGQYDYALGLSRSALCASLRAKAVSLGVSINFDTKIENVQYQSKAQTQNIDQPHTDDQTVTLIDQQGTYFKGFDLVIDASGANSKLRRFAKGADKTKHLQYGSLSVTLDLPPDSPHNTNEMSIYLGDENLGIGLMPIGKNALCKTPMISLFFNVKWRDYLQWNEEAFKKWKISAYQRWPYISNLLDKIESPKQLYLAKYRQHTLNKPCAQQLVFVGDAASCSSPQLGQGVNMSLIDAVILSQEINNHTQLASAIQAYVKQRRTHVTVYQILAKLLTPFYQSDSDLAIAARNWGYKILSRLPLMTRVTSYLLSGRLGDPLKHLKSNHNLN